MEWLAGIAVIGGVIWLFRKSLASAWHVLTITIESRKTPPVPDRSRQPESYATIIFDDRNVPASAEDVERVFGPAREEFAACRKAARRLSKTAKKASRCGRVSATTIAEAATAQARAETLVNLAEGVFERVFFKRESETERWRSFIQDCHDVEAEIDDALDVLLNVRDTSKGPG